MKTLLITLALVASLQAAPESSVRSSRIPNIKQPAPKVVAAEASKLTTAEYVKILNDAAQVADMQASLFAFYGEKEAAQRFKGRADAYRTAAKLAEDNL